MSNDLNYCSFIGRLGRDPEIKYIQDGTAIANFSIAVGESYKDRSGQKIDKTEWIRCVAWRKLAEIIGEYLKKGSQIFISGKFTTRTWEKEGVKQYTTEIVVNNMQMLGDKGRSSGSESNQDRSAPPEPPKSDDVNDDLPF